MPKDRATLKADGTVTVKDFLLIVGGLAEVLFALTNETANNPGAIEWVVDGLKAGSATIVTRGYAGTFLATHDVEQVVDRFEQLARNAHSGRIDEYTAPVQAAVRNLASLVDGRITRIAMGAGDDSREWTIDPKLGGNVEDVPTVEAGVDVNRYARSSVKGQVVTLDDKQAVYFTLREAHTGELIRCYPDKNTKAKLSKYWAENTWVIVEGTYQRYTSTPTMHKITEIVEVEQVQGGSWRDAIGCAPRLANHDVSAADAVRRVRDG